MKKQIELLNVIEDHLLQAETCISAYEKAQIDTQPRLEVAIQKRLKLREVLERNKKAFYNFLCDLLFTLPSGSRISFDLKLGNDLYRADVYSNKHVSATWKKNRGSRNICFGYNQLSSNPTHFHALCDGMIDQLMIMLQDMSKEDSDNLAHVSSLKEKLSHIELLIASSQVATPQSA